jgi:hypothetical protein
MSTIKGVSGEEIDLPVLAPNNSIGSYSGSGSSYSPRIPPLRQRARNDGLTTDTRQEHRQLSASPLLVPTLWWIGGPGGGGST